MDESPVEITMESRLLPHPNLFLREEDDWGGLLFDPDTGDTRLLNETAAEAWKLMDGRLTLTQVVAALRKQFEGMDANAEDEVLELAKELYRLGAVGLSEEMSG